MKRVERHEVDARPVEAKTKPVQSDKEGSRDDEPAVTGQKRGVPADNRAILHGRILDRPAGPTLAVFGPDPPTESDSS